MLTNIHVESGVAFQLFPSPRFLFHLLVIFSNIEFLPQCPRRDQRRRTACRDLRQQPASRARLKESPRLMNRAGMMYAMPLTTETAMNVPAAKSQISIFVCSSIGYLPLASSRQNLNRRSRREFLLPARLNHSGGNRCHNVSVISTGSRELHDPSLSPLTQRQPSIPE